ncbi:MAG: CBS domain-containing protein [Deltaproteobacteria bacterium]|nr:MAG: CBS domain-containing protein [Deltaproteobacteria bacterium]
MSEPEVTTVGQIMSVDVTTIGAEHSLQEAIKVMISKGIRHLPVMKDGKIVAVISDRDLRMMVTDLVDNQSRVNYLKSTPVLKHASRPVSTTTPDAAITDAARMFVEQRIGCLPVLDDDDRLVGIITQTDLLKWVASLADMGPDD